MCQFSDNEDLAVPLGRSIGKRDCFEKIYWVGRISCQFCSRILQNLGRGLPKFTEDTALCWRSGLDLVVVNRCQDSCGLQNEKSGNSLKRLFRRAWVENLQDQILAAK